MKGFFKGLFTLCGMLAAAVGVLTVLDKLTSKNRIDGDYLDCSEEETQSE